MVFSKYSATSKYLINNMHEKANKQNFSLLRKLFIIKILPAL